MRNVAQRPARTKVVPSEIAPAVRLVPPAALLTPDRRLAITRAIFAAAGLAPSTDETAWDIRAALDIRSGDPVPQMLDDAHDDLLILCDAVANTETPIDPDILCSAINRAAIRASACSRIHARLMSAAVDAAVVEGAAVTG